MVTVFFLSLFLIGYAYIGYPAVLSLRRKIRTSKNEKPTFAPTVSVLMAVRNEGWRIEEKVRNLRNLEYPGAIQLVIVSDGSTDSTNEVLQRLSEDGVPSQKFMPVVLARSVGKAAALNAALPHATGEILFLTDVRQRLELDSLRHLVEAFADPQIGAASGELMLQDEQGKDSGAGLYWKIEKMVRKLESETGSVVGVTGAIYAIRRELMPELPPGTILDDVYVPMQVARAGKRVVFVPGARAWDTVFAGRREFRRKVRTLTGNYQIVQLAPWLLTWRNPLLFEFVSHKLMRLGVPFALVGMFVSSLFLLANPWIRVFVLLQVACYLLAAIGMWRTKGMLGRFAQAANSFVVLNSAAALALLYFLSRKRELWTR